MWKPANNIHLAGFYMIALNVALNILIELSSYMLGNLNESAKKRQKKINQACKCSKKTSAGRKKSEHIR